MIEYHKFLLVYLQFFNHTLLGNILYFNILCVNVIEKVHNFRSNTLGTILNLCTIKDEIPLGVNIKGAFFKI